MVQNFAFFVDREVCAKIKKHENVNSGVNITSLLEMRMHGGRLEIDDQLCSRWIEIAMALFIAIFNLQTPFRTPKDHFQHILHNKRSKRSR